MKSAIWVEQREVVLPGKPLTSEAGAGGVVQAVRAVVNPDELGHKGPAYDLARLPEKKIVCGPRKWRTSHGYTTRGG